MLRNYKFIIAYDGTRFFGWERQPGRDTIQGKLESVLTRLQGSPVEIIGAGRTDAGVHARAMAANAQLDVDLSPEEIRDYMNRYLPDAIAVREVKEAAPRFHARYKALGKTYRYVCFDGPVKPVFDRKYVTLLDFHPDLERMQQAAAYLQGEHDFASFCGNPRMRKNPPSGWWTASPWCASGTASCSRSTEPAFCRIWCASWWAPCWRWAAGPGSRRICPPCWRPGTAAWPVPPPRRRACA